MAHNWQIAFMLLLAFSVSFAIWKGGAPERVGGLLILGMLVWQYTAESIVPSRFTIVDPVPLITDMAGFLGFGFLALQARRFWPLWATSLQLLSLSAHFARWADLEVAPLVYALMRAAPTFGAMIALSCGTVLHLQRLRRHGCDPSWQNWAQAPARSGRSPMPSSRPW